jgi:uncharacterized membrane protein YhaH (DUF805 family)
MDWQQLLTSFEGRISRQPFWIGSLVVVGANLVVSMLIGGFIGAIVSVALIYPSVCVAIKRWHDRGKPGWWVLIGLIPVIGWIWTLVECGFLEGDPGDNEYGPNPLASA